MTAQLAVTAATQVDAARRQCDDLSDLLDEFTAPDYPSHVQLTSARGYVAALSAALDRLDLSLRKAGDGSL